MSKETALLVDGNNIVMRSMKAAEGRITLSSNGVNTGPLVLFIGLLTKYVRHVKPDRVVVCFDHGVSLRRLAVYPEYKGNRPQRSAEQEDERDSAFFLAKQWLSLSNVFHVSMPNHEADDLIGYYWRALSRMDAVILSGDKDLLQLVGPSCIQIRPQQGFSSVEEETWTRDRVVEHYGIREPSDLVLLKALQGDPSDNIRGVPQIGPKRALKLAREGGWSLDRVAERLAHEQREIVLRNYDLIDLRSVLGLDLPEPPAFRPTMPGSIAWDDLLDFYERHEMASLKVKAHDLWG